MSQDEYQRKNESIAILSALAVVKVIATLVGRGYTPEVARPYAQAILFGVYMTMLAHAVGNQ